MPATAIADRKTDRPPLTVAPKVWDFLQGTNARTNLLYGSAGSSKSWQVARHLIFNKFYAEKGVVILVVRRTLPALRKSALQLILDTLRLYNLPHGFNKSHLVISNGPNKMYFLQLDDVEKLKSIEAINYVWCEEATEIGARDFRQLHLRCRGIPNKGSKNQLFFTFNPVDENSFLKPLTEQTAAELEENDTAVCHSTYEDNPFLEADARKAIERLRGQDALYWKIYGEGVWATPTNIVYTNWDVVPDSAWPAQFDDERYGLDFGFSSSEAAAIHVRRVGLDLYERQLVYEKKLTTPDLMGRMRGEVNQEAYTRIIADSARPDDIEEIHRKGFNIHGCKKGPGSVKTGIQRVKQYRVHILESSIDLQAEKRGYKWKEDKDGNVLPAVVEFRDHLMDAERYAVSDMTRPSYESYGTAGDMQAVEDAKATADDSGVRAMIDELANASGERVTAICQAFVRNPTPAVLAALRANQDSDNAQVSMRCREILRVLKATGKA